MTAPDDTKRVRTILACTQRASGIAMALEAMADTDVLGWDSVKMDGFRFSVKRLAEILNETLTMADEAASFLVHPPKLEA